MIPDLRPGESKATDVRSRRVLPDRMGPRPSTSVDAIARLAEASSARSRRDSAVTAVRARRRIGVAPALLAAIVVGAALLFAEPFQHLCGATFRVTETSNRDRITFYRKELLDFTWADVAQQPDADQAGPMWMVDEPEFGLLRAYRSTTDRQRGVERANVVARGFLTHLNALARETRTTPTEGETILEGYVRQFQARLADTQEQFESAIAALPDSDPRLHRETLLANWGQLQSDFKAAREQLAQTARQFDNLKGENEQTTAVVMPAERRDVLEADEALQQDFKELAATLTELKLHMLNVWQRSSAALEKLESAGSAFQDWLTKRITDAPPQDIHDLVENLSVESSSYRESAAAFSHAWTAEFKALQQREVDAQSGDLLDAYLRARTLLNDFLFSAGQKLSAMRSRVNEAARQPRDNARLHVVQSELMRGFQEVQSAHHRFEFAAGSLETPDNFRLDSALRIARGLRRRITDRTKAIEDRLKTEATERAKKQRLETMAAIEAVLEKTRASSDETIDRLLAVQEGLNQTANLSEAFVTAVLRAELANSRLQLTREDLARMEAQLRELAARRASAGDEPPISLAACGVVQSAVNLPERLRVAGVGAGVAFVAVLLGQLFFRNKP